MAHPQVKEEMRAAIKLVRREMYPLFRAKRPNGSTDYDAIARAGGMLMAHDILIKRYMQILRNEERDLTDEEHETLSLVTANDIMREYDRGNEI